MRLFGTLFLLLMLPLSIQAAELKFGYIDLKEVIAKSEPGAKAMKELKQKFEGMKNELDKQKKEIDALQASLQKQSLVLSQDAKMDKELEFKRKVRDFQDMYQNYQLRMKQDEQRLSSPILQQLVTIIKNYGKKHNYTMLFDSNSSGLLYADDATNLSEQIIKELNAAWKKRK